MHIIPGVPLHVNKEDKTNMKRMSVTLPPDVMEEIERLKRTPKYANCSYGQIVRDLLHKGLIEAEKQRGEKL